MHWVLALFGTCALAGSSCSILPPEPRSPVRLQRPWGTVGAATPEGALWLAEIIAEVLPVYRELEGFVERPLRAHLVDRPLPGASTAGITISAPEPIWIAVQSDGSDVGRTVAHELAHFYFHELLRVFPVVLEEGLCDVIADRVYPHKDLERKVVTTAVSHLERFTVVVNDAAGKAALGYLVEEVPTIEETLALDWRQHFTADVRTLDSNYGLGTVLARVIGTDGLLELARRCEREGLEKVPTSWILAAADLDPPSQENLARAFSKALGVAELKPGERVTVTLGGP